MIFGWDYLTGRWRRVRAAKDSSLVISPSKLLLASFNTLDDVVTLSAAGNLALNTDHRGIGTHSVEWDKLGTGVIGGVGCTCSAIDLSEYSTHSQIMLFMNVPTPVGGVITQIYVVLGTDAGNAFYWEIDLAEIAYDQWKHYHNLMSEIDGVVGVGGNLSAITFVGIYIITSVAGATLTDVLINEVVVKRGFETIPVSLSPPHSEYFQDDGGVFPDWNALAIGGGDVTLSVDVLHHSNKTIYFISDALGVLTIEVLEPDEVTWRTYDTPAIVANTLLVFTMTGQATRVRISFNNAATISAWITLG